MVYEKYTNSKGIMKRKRMNILLDLDQTCISAEASEEFDFDKNKSKSKNFKYYDMDGYYTVFERPGLQEFLDYLFKNFNVSVWTAASKDYALFIVDKIILGNHTDRTLEYIFFSYHCDISYDEMSGSKDLSMLWGNICNLPGFKKDNTIIIDDYIEVYDTQPGNTILAPPFEFTDSKSIEDKFLPELVTFMKSKYNDSIMASELTKEINKHFKSNVQDSKN